MATNRYLVEGENLEVLLAQVRRMGRRVTLLSAEKVRSGGVGGFFTHEHYELLVEVEGLGQLPENFRPAPARTPRSAPPAKPATAASPAAPATTPPAASASAAAPAASAPAAPAITGAALAGAVPPPADRPAVGSMLGASATAEGSGPVIEDRGLSELLSLARDQLSSGTEKAAADVDAQLAAMAQGTSLAAVNPATPFTPAAPTPATFTSATPSGGANANQNAAGSAYRGEAVAKTTSAAPGLVDARLQGVAAPGAASAPSAAPARPGVISGSSVGWSAQVPALTLKEFGLPAELLAQVPASPEGKVDVSALAAALPERAEVVRKAGAVIAVVGPAPQAAATVAAAQRLAGRLGPQAYCVLGGAKTALPGEGERARSADELQDYLRQYPERTCVLALADSLVDAHRRTMAKLLSVVYVDQVWAVVDARVAPEKIHGWISSLPDALRPDALAVQRIWEAPAPGRVLELGLPIGMLDGVPARPAAWAMLMEDYAEIRG